jgi:hypothetical protein
MKTKSDVGAGGKSYAPTSRLLLNLVEQTDEMRKESSGKRALRQSRYTGEKVRESNPFRSANVSPTSHHAPLIKPTDFEVRVLNENTYQNVIVNSKDPSAHLDWAELVRSVSLYHE